MGEFRIIADVSRVHVEDVLAERISAVLGERWRDTRLKGEAWALVEGGRARGIGGIEPVWSGRYVLWSYAADLGLREWGQVLRFTRLRIVRALEREGVRRVECTASLSAPHYGRFLERLGFTYEGTLRAYGPGGETMAMYSQVRE